MRRTSSWLTVMAVGIGMLGGAYAPLWAEEGKQEQKTVTIDQVPAAARKTILQEAAKNAIGDIKEVTRGKRTFYVTGWKCDDREVDIKVCASGKLLEKEAEVTIEQVPEAVKKTILKEAGDNKIEKIEVKTQGGQTVYEAEWRADGKEVEIKVCPKGKLLDKDAKLTLDCLPAAVKETILKEADKNKIEEIEKKTQDGRTVYEAEWRVGDKEVEIKVCGATGKLLSKEVEEADDDEDDDDDDQE